MAQKVLVQLIDDLDGTAASDVSTVLFGLDGVTYEIDLTDSNAETLRELLGDYVKAARRTGGRARRNIRPGATSVSDTAQVREWAAANGIELAARGRIPNHVIEEYQAAQDEPAPTASAVKKPPRSTAAPAKKTDRPATTRAKSTASKPAKASSSAK